MKGSRRQRVEELKGLFSQLLDEHFSGAIELKLREGELVGVVISEAVMKDKQKTEDLIWNKSEGEGYA